MHVKCAFISLFCPAYTCIVHCYCLFPNGKHTYSRCIDMKPSMNLLNVFSACVCGIYIMPGEFNPREMFSITERHKVDH